MEVILLIIFIVVVFYMVSKSKRKFTPNNGDSVLFPNSSTKTNVGRVGKSKIFMCIKDLKWAIEAMPNVDRAYILAMTTALKITMIRDLLIDLGVSEDILKYPNNYSDKELYNFYTEFEKIRNQSTTQRELTEKNLKKMGMPMPEYAKGHAIATERALEVWMCTLAIGIIDDNNGDIKKIWKMLSGSSGLIDSSIDKIIHHSDKTEEDTGIRDGIFDNISRDEWIRESLVLPNF